MKIDNPPAFPILERGPHCNEGMSLRDWFAGQALPAVIAQIYRVAETNGEIEGGVAKPVATFAYEVADAMLAARQPINTDGGMS